MNTPSPKFVCPDCRTVYTTDQNFCGKCGADMKHVSGLRYKRDVELGDEADSSSQLRQTRKSSGTRPARPESDIGARATEEIGAWNPPPMQLSRRSDGRDPWLGMVIDNRYKVAEVIGRGGMGVVYKVEHQRMGKVAAMKVLHGDLANEPEVVGRFRREAEAVSRLNHPNTVQVFDFGATHGALYLIMEYVRGLDLGSLIKRDGPLEFERAAPLIGQVCAALIEAHELGVIHRDLKPENILVTRTHGGRDFVKVLDFGLAKLSEREELSEVTDRGSIVGTPYYMSPEQIRGEHIDARSDIYSLGALMYKVLTGEPAFAAKTPVGVLTKHLTADVVPPSERASELGIDPRIDDIVLRALEKDPDARYAKVGDLLEHLEQAFLDLCASSPSRGMPGLSMSSAFTSSTGRRSRAALLDDEVDYGMDSAIRLQRSDLDSYERSLKRRRWVGVAIVPLLLLAAGAVAAYLVFLRPTPIPNRDVEPNNTPAEATAIDLDTDVPGKLGKRIAKAIPDKDFYRVVAPTADDTTVTVTVSGLPNIDVELFLYDSTGTMLVQRSEAGVGAGETIRSFRLAKPAYVMVSEVLPEQGALPIENVSDSYTLRVSYGVVSAGTEVEPNDGMADAIELAPKSPITGYLDRRQDVDTFRFTGPQGAYTLRISGAANVPLVWKKGGAEPRAERSATIELAPGDLITLERTDRELDASALLPGANEPYALELGPAS